MNIRLPNITADTERGKLEQIRNYLFQMVSDLNYALTTVEKSATEAQKAPVSAKQATGAAAQAVFPEIKALIIKSADIVNAYYDEISKRLEGVYVAESDFGKYKEETANVFSASSTEIMSKFSALQQIVYGTQTQISEVEAYIKAGRLYETDKGYVHGVEIGQVDNENGVEVFNKYARFTADKLSFYDRNGTEVAYISDQKLYITSAEIKFSFALGNFVEEVQSDGSIIGRWR